MKAVAVLRTQPRGLVVGGGMLCAVAAACLLGPVFVGSPLAANPSVRLSPPSLIHPFGTDDIGRDILSRTLSGGRLDLLIALAGSGTAFIVGCVVGVALGYAGGRWTELVMRGWDVIQAFPFIIFAMLLLAFVSKGLGTFIAALACVNIPVFVRLIRSETLSVRELPFVDAARVVGNSPARLIRKHIVPNVITSSLVQLTNTAAWAILLTGALSFLGVGVQPPTPEWGAMIQTGSQYVITGQWWGVLFPGAAIATTALALHLIGDGMVQRRRVR
jgi:peptide/nickel transport system permease protein